MRGHRQLTACPALWDEVFWFRRQHDGIDNQWLVCVDPVSQRCGVAGGHAFIRAGPAVMAKGIKCEACRVIRMSQRQESLGRQKIHSDKKHKKH
ncbi:hypothetical protein ASA_2085 [Aeromonas salmonicida subsp. salmonicida A449]|uniref:Uncharacterized protein n=1 Tax=Aeromonas salmonicida (strain A449) TaxID=382245 RepID=A4SMM9_AERS4|nr:hypothetical protein ASA_2085 [Aeromonas salmonicida subsp. salmonicida A449]